MAVTRAIAASGETIEDSELTVTSALDANVRVFLPVIADGSSDTVAAGYVVNISANGAGYIEVLSATSYRVAIVRKGDILNLEAYGDAADSRWVVSQDSSQLFTGVQPSAGSSTPVLGTTGPGSTASVNSWMNVTLPNGTQGFIPIWK